MINAAISWSPGAIAVVCSAGPEREPVVLAPTAELPVSGRLEIDGQGEPRLFPDREAGSPSAVVVRDVIQLVQRPLAEVDLEREEGGGASLLGVGEDAVLRVRGRTFERDQLVVAYLELLGQALTAALAAAPKLRVAIGDGLGKTVWVVPAAMARKKRDRVVHLLSRAGFGPVVLADRYLALAVDAGVGGPVLLLEWDHEGLLMTTRDPTQRSALPGERHPVRNRAVGAEALRTLLSAPLSELGKGDPASIDAAVYALFGGGGIPGAEGNGVKDALQEPLDRVRNSLLSLRARQYPAPADCMLRVGAGWRIPGAREIPGRLLGLPEATSVEEDVDLAAARGSLRLHRSDDFDQLPYDCGVLLESAEPYRCRGTTVLRRGAQLPARGSSGAIPCGWARGQPLIVSLYLRKVDFAHAEVKYLRHGRDVFWPAQVEGKEPAIRVELCASRDGSIDLDAIDQSSGGRSALPKMSVLGGELLDEIPSRSFQEWNGMVEGSRFVRFWSERPGERSDARALARFIEATRGIHEDEIPPLPALAGAALSLLEEHPVTDPTKQERALLRDVEAAEAPGEADRAAVQAVLSAALVRMGRIAAARVDDRVLSERLGALKHGAALDLDAFREVLNRISQATHALSVRDVGHGRPGLDALHDRLGRLYHDVSRVRIEGKDQGP